MSNQPTVPTLLSAGVLEQVTLITDTRDKLNNLIEKFTTTIESHPTFTEKLREFFQFFIDAIIFVEDVLVAPKSGKLKHGMVLGAWLTLDYHTGLTETLMDKWFVGAYNKAVRIINLVPFIKNLPTATEAIEWLVSNIIIEVLVMFANQTIWKSK